MCRIAAKVDPDQPHQAPFAPLLTSSESNRVVCIIQGGIVMNQCEVQCFTYEALQEDLREFKWTVQA